jgi:hypothetical protein
MGIINEPFLKPADIELASAVRCILEPLNCSHRAEQPLVAFEGISLTRFHYYPPRVMELTDIAGVHRTKPAPPAF